MSARARAFVLLFVAVALAAILPPLFCLIPARAAKAPAVVEEARAAPVLQIVGGSPAVYVTHAVGIVWPPSSTPVFCAHTADELVIGCACNRCQQFVRRNP